MIGLIGKQVRLNQGLRMELKKKEQRTLLVFCYGSNMSSKRIKKRCPSARFLSTAYLTRYKFGFNKVSSDGSSKGNIIFTGLENDLVRGVIFEISQTEKIELDRAEGLGSGYDEQTIAVRGNDSELIQVQVYLATGLEYLNETLLPFDWYHEHCLRGAREFNLLGGYIGLIEDFNRKIDENGERRKKELSIYD